MNAKSQFDGVIDMKIREVNENKKQFIALLLLADEQENMIDHYLEKGTMYVLEDGNVKLNVSLLMKIMEYLKLKILQLTLRIKDKAMGKH